MKAEHFVTKHLAQENIQIQSLTIQEGELVMSHYISWWLVRVFTFVI